MAAVIRISASFVLVLVILSLAGRYGASAPSSVDPLQIEAAAPDLEVSLAAGESNTIRVLFRNNSATPIQILKPIDGSEWSWVMPYYAFSLTDDRGREFSMSMRCAMCGGPYADTAWPADYLVTIQPGGTYEHEGYLNYYFNDEQEYLVSFRYVFNPDSEFLRDGPLRYPPGLWRGETKSPTLRVKLKPQPFVVG